MHIRIFLLAGTLFSALALGILHSMAVTHAWYWMYWWFDVLTHTLGGLVWGMVVLAVLRYRRYWNDNDGVGMRVLLIVTLSVLGVGLLWEGVEYVADIFRTEPMFPDSLHDLVADIAGALIAVLFARIVSLITECRQHAQEHTDDTLFPRRRGDADR